MKTHIDLILESEKKEDFIPYELVKLKIKVKYNLKFMKTTFNILRQSRENFISILDSFKLDQLNTVPIGFNNNLIWNIAHVVATFDLLAYRLNGLEPKLELAFIEEFKKGTIPTRIVNKEFVDDLKLKLREQIIWIEKDYNDKLFPSSMPKPYLTSYNFELNTIEDILHFNVVHENLHMGICFGLRKFI